MLNAFAVAKSPVLRGSISQNLFGVNMCGGYSGKIKIIVLKPPSGKIPIFGTKKVVKWVKHGKRDIIPVPLPFDLSIFCCCAYPLAI